ncbi:hypothetical protein [Candidatus Palauibacter sp.]|uniref:hypothetical protein n=1 Tax=Candidatus Palauibacter sp. TaxID=3101350 RepID=UPI003B01E7CF
MFVPIALLAAACGEPGDSASPSARLEPYASVVSPPSMFDEVVLLEAGSACVIDTYLYRVVCTDPGDESFMFGAEGEGPGEFTDPGGILRGPAGTIGVVDRRLDRLSMFSGSGGFLTSTPGIPSFLLASGPSAMGGTMVGSYYRLDLANGSSFVNAEIDTATGRIVWERTFPDEADVVDCSTPTPGGLPRQLGFGYHDESGGLLFVTCYGEFLVWYADRDAGEPAAIVRSTYVERYPTEEDVAASLRLLNSIPAGGFRPNLDEEQIRARPKVWYGARVVDDQRRFWAVSYWNAEDVIPALSHIEMYRLTDTGPEYALTLQVADKVLGMDVLGNTLAVLVERDTGGVISERRVDWFDVAALTARR